MRRAWRRAGFTACRFTGLSGPVFMGGRLESREHRPLFRGVQRAATNGTVHLPVTRTILTIFCLTSAASMRAASFYPQRLEDPPAVYISPSGGDDTATLQQALNKVQETTRQGMVLLAPGHYRISDTLYIWPGIRMIGYGPERPVLVLPANTPGFGDASREKFMIWFAGGRPGFNRA